ncbi:hypothetical protein BCR43DRAFT_564376 [Syncephalastrum racemosum]|uniref:Uncharacterized protein n=1 Tax=Syncephalastrum racemosum TaxID=13706 RepID=A0A1X2HBB7_SYNRA|nr:hypothetical protein BCR43DRAFT_564376 [Syncephalastrum racemosum]
MDRNTRDILATFNQAKQANATAQTTPNNRLLEGLSTSLTRKLDTLSRSELRELHAKNDKLLQNTSLVNTLPDKGAKLRTSNAQIDALLERATSPMVTDTPPKDSGKKQPSLDDVANAMSRMQVDTRDENSRENPLSKAPPRIRMLSLEESVKLQEEQQQAVKDEKLRRQMEALKPTKRRTSESLADDLSLTVAGMKLNPETGPHRPQDDDGEEEESDSEDEDSIDRAIYDSQYEDDDEGFDEEEEYMDDQRRH